MSKSKRNTLELPEAKPLYGQARIPDIDVVLKSMSIKYLKGKKSDSSPMLVTLDDLKEYKIPYVRTYMEKFSGSKDLQEMTPNEFSTFHWLLIYLWQGDIQCFLPYTLRELKPLNISAKKFVDAWESILKKKFSVVIINQQTYLYHEQQLKEWFVSRAHAINGKKGADEKWNIEKIPVSKPHTFKDSPYFDKKKLESEINSDPDLHGCPQKAIDHWYNVMKTWGKEKKNAKDKLSSDWYSKIKNHLLSDLYKSSSRSNGSPKPSQGGQPSNFRKNFSDLELRQKKIKQRYGN